MLLDQRACQVFQVNQLLPVPWVQQVGAGLLDPLDSPDPPVPAEPQDRVETQERLDPEEALGLPVGQEHRDPVEFQAQVESKEFRDLLVPDRLLPPEKAEQLALEEQLELPDSLDHLDPVDCLAPAEKTELPEVLDGLDRPELPVHREISARPDAPVQPAEQESSERKAFQAPPDQLVR